MLKYVVIYVAVLLAIGIYDFFKVKSFEDYAVAGKKQSQTYVIMSLMATMIGASATIGVMGRVSSIGFPAFWWLGVGSIGLFVQAIFLSEKIRNMEAYTLPDLVDKLVGRGGRIIVALIIIIAWPGIVASQILAMSSILAIVTGRENNKILLLIVAVVIILYTVIGGQLSVIKTDALQFIIIGTAFVAVFIYLFACGGKDNEAVFSTVELINGRFGVADLIIQLFIVGGTYLLGPDIISRNLVAKDGRTAKKSAIIAGGILIVFSVIIVLIGLWINENVAALDGLNPLLYIINNILPTPIGVLLAVGILSTLLSSADTCLINISSIIEHDILKKDRVWAIRLWAVIVGAVAVIIAFFKGDIISMLTGAYSVYAPGVVAPLFIAIMSHRKRRLNIPIWILAVISGGMCGALSTYVFTEFTKLPIIGMLVSLLLGIASYIAGKKETV